MITTLILASQLTVFCEEQRDFAELVMNYGNRTKAAQQLRCHRHVVRKYTLVRQEKPMVGRWRDNTGEPVIRKGKIQIEYVDGTTDETYASKINWESPEIVRWRPYYA